MRKTRHVLLFQLPIPRLNFGMKTGNIPLGAAYLKQASSSIRNATIEIIPETIASYLADHSLVDYILSKKPDIIGFTVFAWNLERSLHIAEMIKHRSGITIIFGGPEITRDNPLILSPHIDCYIYGEGEIAFRELLQDETFPDNKVQRHMDAPSSGDFFRSAPSPYVSGYLSPEIENIMMLETQRGCPYHCGFCYYNKSRKNLVFTETPHLLDGIRWAVENNIEELYLLDPSLNARPELKSILREIAVINKNNRVSINSEIRAEWIDEESADLFAEAGFTSFEIGLQSTNPEALRIMRRPTDIDRFLKGTFHLKNRDILPRIDLIIGLPGDTLEGFKKSISFVSDQGLDYDTQVFPLSILPGTEFRQKRSELGISFEKHPPYMVTSTKTYSNEDMILSLDYAESLFDVSLLTFPDQDLSWRNRHKQDIHVRLHDEEYITKLVLRKKRPMHEIEASAKRLTTPYQIFVTPEVKDKEYIARVLNITSSINPFTPFEIVFLEPHEVPDTAFLLSYSNLKRPHFLDNDMRFLYSEPGNRAIIFTVATSGTNMEFSGEMKRNVFLWNRPHLPEVTDLEDLSQMDGILINCEKPESELLDWQSNFAESAEEIVEVSFADIKAQAAWKNRVSRNEYNTRLAFS